MIEGQSVNRLKSVPRPKSRRTSCSLQDPRRDSHQNRNGQNPLSHPVANSRPGAVRPPCVSEM
jgi:hypothetical protein